jgi:hypothetical protein
MKCFTSSYRKICNRHHVQTGCEVHPPSIQVAIGNFFQEVKQPEHKINHSPPTIATVKNIWSLTSPIQHTENSAVADEKLQ